MLSTSYYIDTPVKDITFPDACMRHIGHLVRNINAIPEYRAVVDRTTDRTFAIVKDGYNLLKHEDVINEMDDLCAQFPEYGNPTREIWMSNYGGRMKTRWTFNDVDFEIAKLADGSPDIVHPTLETMGSYDTSLAQNTLVGGFRTICSNGLRVWKILGEYKRKHTLSLDLEKAKNVLAEGMANYNKATDLWISYTKRKALTADINCYDTLGFNKNEKLSIEAEIKRQGNVITWDDEDVDKRNVEISTWDLLNIYTAEASHRINNLERQNKVFTNISKTFQHA